MTEKEKIFGRLVMKIAIGLLIVTATFGGCSYINDKMNMADDNLIEQFLEAQIESKTGIEIDLTPED